MIDPTKYGGRVIGSSAPTTPESTPEKKPGVLQNIGEFLAPLGKPLGESFAQQYASKLQENVTKQQIQINKALVDRLKQLKGNPKAQKNLMSKMMKTSYGTPQQTIQEQTPGFNTTNKQVAGAALTTLLNTTTGGRFAAPTVGARVAEGAAEGALYGIGAGMEANQNNTQIVASGAVGAGIGVGVSLIGSLLGKTRKVLKNRPPITVERAVGVPTNELQPQIFYPESKTVGERILAQDYRGGPEKIIQRAKTIMEGTGTALEKVLEKHSDKLISGQEIKAAAKTYLETVPPGFVPPGWKKMIESIPDIMTPKEANVLKQSFAKGAYGFIKTATGKANPISTETKAFNKVIADSLRSAIDTTTGDATIRTINEAWSTAFNTRLWMSYRAAAQRKGYGTMSAGLVNLLSRIYYKTLGSTRSKMAGANFLYDVVNPVAEKASFASPAVRGASLEGFARLNSNLQK